ncbi:MULTISPECIES: nitroreductase family protein [Acinetobacter]|uniref:Nitroreductase family protein n=1 Tax=Acinetobacter piscicola TaxID=2006115 RepID=A0A4Q4H3B2_9GAMM|nr:MULTISPECIES: nitroreductase family protein [Acinetobacter]MDM1756713.1 nitroreductase family protein [Acinetobacter sp. 256-1]MDM1759553.1 nitroreductase family protein [Acinetobacter sp. 251-1]QOW45572.1 nitroreductase family protein [Acinetobacter piscicola]RYL28434.1 nitroreductase family protein [Acinetobacter piscicola]
MSQENSTKQRYYEPAPQDIDVDNFKLVLQSRRSVRKFTEKQIPNDILEQCLDLALLAPNSSNLQPWTFYVVQNQAKKTQLVKACLGQLAAKTAAELIVCVARTDRVNEMSKRNISEFPFPEVPPAVQKYYKYIPYNYKTGYFNTLGNFKKVAFKIARSMNKQLPVTAFNPADAQLWAAKTTALACENFVLALRAYGFDSCMMEGFDEPMLRQILNLNDQQYPVMVIAAGERAKDGVFFPQYRFDRDLFIEKV